MSEIQIHAIPILPFGMVNAFLLTSTDGAVLVDTGLPDSERKIGKGLSKAGCSLAGLKLIVVTHGHIDHAGSAARIRKLSGAPIVLHEGDLPYCQGRAPLLRPSGPFGRLFKMTGAIERPFAKVEPDILLSADQTLDLSAYGLTGEVLPTPGHTPGSLSVLLADGTVIAGDLAASGILLGGIAFKGWPKPPPFEEDTIEVARSLKLLLSKGAKRFYLGHGGPLDARAIERYAGKLAQAV
ncbi:MBL fold metallo-hydrolase [Stappia sp. BW2]|uniref:MBL fold metallo-hydrolase n=1 Tax=Stappia sp. BW2 TaxID=2592622 RepID=UPI0011DED2FD|nr:MBL fold metallo-hydrolase [Stappia sp. BW2]TYC64695.1 MBL fold metallo-hydrolase [Stappia sp. BW2]